MTRHVAHGKAVDVVSGRIYDVCARRDGRWWIVTVPQLPGAFSQVRRLDQVSGAIREAIAFVASLDVDDIEIRVDVGLPVETLQRIDSARQASSAAARAQVDAAREVRATVRQLLDEGLTGHDVAHLMGVSPQRVSQLSRSGSRLRAS